ncbi:hypothetical protein Tco_1176100 [Tanacetum coccineum]
MTITHSGMTPEAIEELISQRVAVALAAQEANRNSGLVVKSQSQNVDDDDNRNGGNRNHGNNNGDGNQNGEMEVQEEMHQSLRLVPTRIFSIVNHATLVALKESSIWLDGSRK